MRKIWLLLLCSLIVIGVAPPEMRTSAAEPQTFKDVKTHWAKSDIEEAVSRGIIEGFPDGTFRPDNIVAADQLLVMLFRAYSKTYSTSKGNQVRWDQAFLQRLNQNFPGRLGAIQNALAENPFYFQKNENGYWAKHFIDFAYEMGYLTTFDSVFPKDYEVFQQPVKREQASYLLGMWFENYEASYDATYRQYAVQTVKLKDMSEFSATAVSGYRGSVLLSGIMQGTSSGYFYPNRFVTRAEAVSMILRTHDPDRRKPFKPDLSKVCYSQTTDYDIHVFEDEMKCATYKRILELAKSTIKNGFVDVGTLGVAIFKDQEEADKNESSWKLGQFDEIPSGEMSFTVGDAGEKFIRVIINTDGPLTFSKPLFNEAILFLVGAKNESIFLEKLNDYREDSSKTKAISIEVSERKFQLVKNELTLVIQYNY